MSSYLLNRNGNYHVRIRVPSDLSSIIPATELVKSLKTRDKKTAAVAALPYRQGILKAFTLLRSGYISEEQALESIDRALNRKGRAMPAAPQSNAPEPLSGPSRAGFRSLICPSDLPKQTRLLSTVVEQFLNDRKHGWGPKTKMENEGSYHLILDLLGDVDIRSIDRLMVRDLRGNLMKLPGNVYKLYPKQTALQVLEMINNNLTPKVSSMSITTVNKHVSRFSTLIKHCIKEGYTKDNPAVGLKIKQKRRPDEERKAYAPEDLKNIAANLPSKEVKPERYWIPLIGMLSGLRLDEACQLHTEDVREIEGVWCFDINDNQGKKLKTLSSNRIVPVHPALINQGFLAHVKMVSEQGAPRLWMNLKWRKEDGYGNALGKWFQRFNREHVTTDPLKSFHSLRHTFADTLKQLGVQEALISELMGHANGNITTGRYGKRYRPQGLLEAVCKLDFRNIRNIA